jgi:hypothetical protein
MSLYRIRNPYADIYFVVPLLSISDSLIPVTSDLNVQISLQGPTSLAWGLEAWLPSSKPGDLDHIGAWDHGPRTCWAPDSATHGPVGCKTALSPKPWFLAP